MSVFGAYSAYYDLLYRDKDYAGEAALEFMSNQELGYGTWTAVFVARSLP